MSSYYVRVVLMMVPLVFVSVLVVLGSSNSLSRWFFQVSTGFLQVNYSVDGGEMDVRQRLAIDLEREKAVAINNIAAAPDKLTIFALAPAPAPAEVGVATAEPPGEPKIIITVENRDTSSRRITRRFHSLEILEAKLQQSRASIRDAGKGSEVVDPDYIPYGPVYRNPPAFHRSYREMEKNFKVFVYNEGEHPIFHHGPCGSIYSIEGNFINRLENSRFRTRDPEKATVFFLPFSMTAMVHFIFERNSRNHWLPMKRTVKDYIDLISHRYPFWNRSLGADHFMLSCHDWGPELSKSLPELFNNSIRALCNANTTEGFWPSKDVSIPEINLPGGRTNGLVGGPSASKRPILAFFAGGVHGPVRPILLEHWENKDHEIRVYKYLPKSLSYASMMRKSKFCICPSGYEVASPRIAEALYTGCVPVLLNDHYVPPFSDVLNWKSFAVVIPVLEIRNLKNVLKGISPRQYIRMQRRGLAARHHFEVHSPAKRYDVFHMILHSVWLRRLNIRLRAVDDS